MPRSAAGPLIAPSILTADFARLAAATPIPLAHGERELTRFQVRDFITIGKITYVQFDATRAGGFT